MTTEPLPPAGPFPMHLVVQPAERGMRLDAFLTQRLRPHSRSLIRRAIVERLVFQGDQFLKPSYRVEESEEIVVHGLPAVEDGVRGEAIPLSVLFEDDHLIAIDKPPGMVVHPAKGHWRGTLAAALSYHCASLSSMGGPTRPGILHRLDRDTSGVILAAKNDLAHQRLAAQFEARTVKKTYLAVVRGVPDRDQDVIELPIGIHPYQRERMAIRSGHPTSRPATTIYRVKERFRGFALLEVEPKTGRTHQIRLHLTHAGLPIVADRLYAGHAVLKNSDVGLSGDGVLLDRQALHAWRLEFDHPVAGARMMLSAELPADLGGLVAALRRAC